MEEQVMNTTQEQSSIENVSNEALANTVADGLNMSFTKMILVKPLEPIKITKTLTVPEDSGEKDEEGNPIMQMTIKDVENESNFRKGVIISLPYSIKATNGLVSGIEAKAGDIIVYNHKRSIDFDLYKDSVLVDPFDVIAFN